MLFSLIKNVIVYYFLGTLVSLGLIFLLSLFCKVVGFFTVDSKKIINYNLSKIDLAFDGRDFIHKSELEGSEISNQEDGRQTYISLIFLSWLGVLVLLFIPVSLAYDRIFPARTEKDLELLCKNIISDKVRVAELVLKVCENNKLRSLPNKEKIEAIILDKYKVV